MTTAATRPATALEPLDLASIRLPNRWVRSATYEGMAGPDGTPLPVLGQVYARLARGGVGTVITGFAYVAPEGRAMQPGQCGIESDTRIAPWRTVLEHARQDGLPTRFFLQLAHAGRQTRRAVTGLPVAGASTRRCPYFRQRVHAMTDREIREAVHAFARAAYRAREAGFDGVQLHGAHGYLIHQFLSPQTNRRRDAWGDRPRFLLEVLQAVQTACGEAFPVLVKLSGEEDASPGIRLADTIATVNRLKPLGVDAVEISYGTMALALNIIRGACPVEVVMRVNPLFRDQPALLRQLWTRFGMRAYLEKFLPFTEGYNLDTAATVRRETGVPVIVVGGIRSAAMATRCLEAGVDAVALCRALIREPDFIHRIRRHPDAVAECDACNLCTVYCDSNRPLRCYRKKGSTHEQP